jgi:hypothetical protein
MSRTLTLRGARNRSADPTEGFEARLGIRTASSCGFGFIVLYSLQMHLDQFARNTRQTP